MVVARKHDTSWRNQGACAEKDINLFFPGQGESSTPAMVICHPCPVKEQCLEYALVESYFWEGSGVWGGTTPIQRRTSRELRKRAVDARQLVDARGYRNLSRDW